MPTLSITKNYSANNVLTAAHLNSLCSSIETFINTTKLDGDNISLSSIADDVAAAMSATGANAIAATMTSTGADAIAADMTATGANAILADVSTFPATQADLAGAAMTATGANAVAATMTATGANAILADVSTFPAAQANLAGAAMTSSGANAIAASMNSTGANAIAASMNATGANDVLNSSSLGTQNGVNTFDTSTFTTSYTSYASYTIVTSGVYIIYAAGSVTPTADMNIRLTTTGGALDPELSLATGERKSFFLMGLETLAATNIVSLEAKAASANGAFSSSGVLKVILLYPT
jgi:hypothetical protein